MSCDTIDELSDGEHTWTIVKDVGIVIVFTDGVSAVTRDTYHGEMMIVSVAASLDSLPLPEVQRRWQSTIGIEYTHSGSCYR